MTCDVRAAKPFLVLPIHALRLLRSGAHQPVALPETLFFKSTKGRGTPGRPNVDPQAYDLVCASHQHVQKKKKKKTSPFIQKKSVSHLKSFGSFMFLLC